MSMSMTKLVTIICWILVAVILIGLAVWFLTGNLFGIKTEFEFGVPAFSIGSFESLSGSFDESGTFTVPPGDVDSLDIDWTAGSVTIKAYDGDTIKVTEFARRSLEDDEKFICGGSGGTLEIKYCTPGLRFNTLTKKLEVLVPKAAAGRLQSVKVSAASASLRISDIKTTRLSISGASGSAEISNVTADSVSVKTMSGGIRITSLAAAHLETNSLSGGIRLADVTADTLIANTASGGLDLSGAFKDIDAGSASGEIRVSSSINPDRINCHSTSGSITAAIPGGDIPAVSYSTVSGRFTSDIPVITGGGASDYKFSTVSGNIRLKAA